MNKRKLMLLSNCEVRNTKKSRFIKKGNGLLSNLRLEISLSKIPLLLDILF